MLLSPDVIEFLRQAKVARLATADLKSTPHIVPVVYLIDRRRFLIPIDAKLKTKAPEKLRRVRNIQKNPKVCLLVDNYDDDWSKLRFVMVEGNAEMASFKKREFEALKERFLAKYPQYKRVDLYNLFIAITPRKVISWANSSSGKLG
jgi:PPOX class probable F420-dependent enzyme